ncbi:MAG: hypothetical protein EZS28_041173, partial [Streblomastix strix]
MVSLKNAFLEAKGLFHDIAQYDCVKLPEDYKGFVERLKEASLAISELEQRCALQKIEETEAMRQTFEDPEVEFIQELTDVYNFFSSEIYPKLEFTPGSYIFEDTQILKQKPKNTQQLNPYVRKELEEQARHNILEGKPCNESQPLIPSEEEFAELKHSYFRPQEQLIRKGMGVRAKWHGNGKLHIYILTSLRLLKIVKILEKMQVNGAIELADVETVNFVEDGKALDIRTIREQVTLYLQDVQLWFKDIRNSIIYFSKPIVAGEDSKDDSQQSNGKHGAQQLIS